MLRKTMRVLLIFALTVSATGAVFAQDSIPETAEDETATRSVYLPLVQAGQQVTDEAEAMNEVEAAGGDRSRPCGDGRVTRRGRIEVVGLTADQRLICFNEKEPRDDDTIGSVTGLTVDTSLVGIDFRPATGELYGLGNAGGIYTLSVSTAQATLRSRLNAQGVNVALSGTFFGVDFNPTVDRLRIVSDSGQNLRVNVDDGVTATDTPLNYPPPGANPATGIAGAAYTNNDADPNTATTLYDLDSVLDQVVVQSPANSGQLAPTGKLTVDTTATIGFDIYSTVRDGATVDNRALASLVVGGQARLFEIMLLTGKANRIGTFRSQNQVIGIAIPLNQQ